MVSGLYFQPIQVIFCRHRINDEWPTGPEAWWSGSLQPKPPVKHWLKIRTKRFSLYPA
jgi:hypothetical protein